MAVSAPNYLKSMFQTTQAMGNKAVNSDFAFEIKGFENTWLLWKQAPWPELSTAGEIEVPTPMGAAAWQPQQSKVNQQGQVTLMETVAGHIDKLLIDLIAKGGTFDATIYDGTPQAYTKKKDLYACFLQIDPTDRDWENRSQILTFSGTLFYHYFGESTPGAGY